MCIICNCGHDGDVFLRHFGFAGREIELAASAMLQCAKTAKERGFASPAAVKRYDRTHKKIVRLLREWNRIEQEREEPFISVHPPSSPPASDTEAAE